MPQKFDIAILGAGPGGSTCALALAGSGLRVALLDQAHFPRDKVCGDAISGKVLSVLKHLDASLLAELRCEPAQQPTWGIRFVAPNGRRLDIPLRQGEADGPPPAYVSARLDFDHFLFRAASRVPEVTVLPGFGARSLRSWREGYELSDGQRVVRTQLLIGADGAHSLVARQLAQARVQPRHHSAGVRLYCRPVGGFHPDSYLELHYLKELLPGYCWVFPLPDGRVNVGLGMLTRDLQRHPINLRRRLLDLLAHHPRLAPRFAGAVHEGPVRGFGLPLGSQQRIISGPRYLLVGDAAGLVDPFTGEGIGNAMVSGRLAARFAQAHLRTGQALAGYDQAVFQKLGAELRLSHQLQRLVRYPRLFNWVASRVGGNESLRLLFTMMFEQLDLRQQLRKPTFYWKLLTQQKPKP
jgi:menaquinone-9 beta-reductase